MTTRSTRSPRRRTVVALAVVLAVLAAFVVRLVDIQIVSAGEYVADSMETALGGSRPLYGTRGAIIDQTGQTLAGSILLYDAQLDPQNVGTLKVKDDDGKTVTVTWDEQAARIAAVTGQTVEEVQKIVADALAENPDSQFAYLKRAISTEEYRELADLGLPSLSFVAHPSRTYPDGAVAGNLVGFMGMDGDPLAGLEQVENGCLAATDGAESFERGKDGVIIPGTLTQLPAVDGGTLQLTINRDLQWYLQQLIAEQVQDQGALSGTITVTEVATGKIRAAAEFPTVDPNNVDGAPPADRGSRIFTNFFEPGSTFKALTASTVIDAGGLSPLSTVIAPSTQIFPNGARVRDSFVHPANAYTLTGVLIDSSNVGIATLGDSVGPEQRYEYLKRFGIGDGSAIGFPGEANGWLTPADQWDNQTHYNTTFGQGVTTTVPELMGAYGAIANGGVRVPLSIVESCTKADGTVVTPELPAPSRVISEASASAMQQVLENVAVQAGYGSTIAIPGYNMAVKTGTGEKADGQGGYKNGVYFTTMIGFAPAESPQYLVAVTLDEPTKIKSSMADAPAFQKAMTQVLKTYRVLPSGAAPTLLPKFG